MTGTLQGWTVEPDAITFVGRDLQRPECILAEPDGTLWTADARGGVMRIAPDGSQSLVAQEIDTSFSDSRSAARYTMNGTLPNGLAFDRGGDILIANFGTDAIERMTRDGRSTTLFTEIEGGRWARRTSCSSTPATGSGSRSPPCSSPGHALSTRRRPTATSA